jgi:hypothetical protein
MSEGRVHLFVNLGTQEPRVKVKPGEFLPLREREGLVARFLGQRGLSKFGLYRAAEKLCEGWDAEQPSEFSFPILEPALEFVKKHAGRIDRVVLIATHAPDRSRFGPDDPQTDDTWHVAQLAKRFFERRFREADTSLEIVGIDHNEPHLYWNAKRKLTEKKDLLGGVEPADRIYVCTSPGLPAVNAALLYRVLHEHSGQSFLFQIKEPNATKLKQGKWDEEATAVAEADIFDDFIEKQLSNLVEGHRYDAAKAMLQLLPDRPNSDKSEVAKLLEAADLQWKLKAPTDALAGKWDKYVVRAYSAVRIANVMFATGEVDEGVAWLGDCASFLKELMEAVSFQQKALALGLDSEAMMLKHPKNFKKELLETLNQRKLPKEWSDLPGQTFGSFWDEAGLLHCWCAEFRNDYTHRLLSKDTSEAGEWLRSRSFDSWGSVCERFSKLLGGLVGVLRKDSKTVANAEQFGSLVPEFSAMNERIKNAISRQLMIEGDYGSKAAGV